MKYFFVTLLVAIIAIVAVFSSVSFENRKLLPENQPISSGDPLTNWQGFFKNDLEIKEEVNRGILDAREKYDLQEKIVIDSSFTDHSYHDAVTFVKGNYFFTRVSLSEKMPGLLIIRLFPVSLRHDNSEDQPLHTIVFDILVEYKLKAINEAKRHG